MRYSFLLPMMLLCPAVSAPAQVSIGISLPGVSIGINQPAYPELVPVPGYPVYYAPGSPLNYFFYDGLYWVYQNDVWYASEWYNGPWDGVDPSEVPLFVLRVPVTYYRQPPVFFNGWERNAPPRWGEHWGRGWEQRHGGWDRWDRQSVPPPAPLPTYQRQYSGDRYPQPRQQLDLHTQNYHYQPREPAVRQVVQQQRTQAVTAPAGRDKPGEPQQKGMNPEVPARQQPVPAPRPNTPQQPAQQPAPTPRPNLPQQPPAPAPRPNTPQQPAQQAPQPPAQAQRPHTPQPEQPAQAPRPHTPQPEQPAQAPRPGPQQPQHAQPPAPRPNAPAPPQQPNREQPNREQPNKEQPHGNPGQEQSKGRPNEPNKPREPG